MSHPLVYIPGIYIYVHEYFFEYSPDFKISSPYTVAARSLAIAPVSVSLSRATSSAEPAVSYADSGLISGYVFVRPRKNSSHWAMACGCEIMRRRFLNLVPGITSKLWRTFFFFCNWKPKKHPQTIKKKNKNEKKIYLLNLRHFSQQQTKPQKIIFENCLTVTRR